DPPGEVTCRGHDQQAEQHGVMAEKHPPLPGHPAVADIPLLVSEKRQVVDVGDDLKVEQAGEAKAGPEFDEEISDRERRAAVPASAAEYPVADEWDVVVPANRSEAGAAV